MVLHHLYGVTIQLLLTFVYHQSKLTKLKIVFFFYDKNIFNDSRIFSTEQNGEKVKEFYCG